MRHFFTIFLLLSSTMHPSKVFCMMPDRSPEQLVGGPDDDELQAGSGSHNYTRNKIKRSGRPNRQYHVCRWQRCSKGHKACHECDQEKSDLCCS